MSGPGFIAVEEPDKCELCGKHAELRPYGPRGERICFECGMKYPDVITRQFRRYVLGEQTH